MDARTAFLTTRPWSFTMTFSSVTLGTLFAALRGAFDPVLYAIVLGGMLAFHAATNILNDFFDVRHGVDKAGAPTTKYRLHPAALGQAPLSSILEMSVSLYALTVLAGAYLAFVRGPAILLLLGLGILGSVLYTADPVVLKARAMGEVTVFAMWGLLIPLGAYAVQAGTLSWTPAVVSVPLGVLVALVLLANNIRDIDYDGSVGNRTIGVRLGAKKGAQLYEVLLAATYSFVVAGVLTSLLPIWSLIVFLTAPEAWKLLKMFRGPVPDNADPRTAGLTLRFALLYMASFVLIILLPIHLPF